jgi:hypothetical protein
MITYLVWEAAREAGHLMRTREKSFYLHRIIRLAFENGE